MEARTNGINTIRFSSMSRAYRPHKRVANVATFVRQAKAFRDFTKTLRQQRTAVTDTRLAMSLGQCMATIAYAQLIAENATRLGLPENVLAQIFHFLVNDLSIAAMTLAALAEVDAEGRKIVQKMIALPALNASSMVPPCATSRASGIVIPPSPSSYSHPQNAVVPRPSRIDTTSDTDRAPTPRGSD